MVADPWLHDACALVDAFRARAISPDEALEASLAAIGASGLNAVTHLDADAARAAAAHADVSLPFGGVPIAVKELEAVRGWPDTEASLVFDGRVADHDSTQVARLKAAGAVVVAQTAASEFGGVNFTSTRLHGTTRNPWDPERTPGGSSGGSAAAVAGGLVPIATGGDGGGSIRIPAAFSGLLGLKPTYGRIPRGPRAHQPPLTVVAGCLARSVRDTARWLDVCNGFDARDTLSLPRVEGFEARLGHVGLAGVRATVCIDFGDAIVEPRQADLLVEVAEAVIAASGIRRVDCDVRFPKGGWEWSLSNLIGLAGTLGDRWPGCSDLLTREIRSGMKLADSHLNVRTAGDAEMYRIEANERMAEIFESTDLIMCATNPDVAFAAEGPMPTTVGTVDLAARYSRGRAIANHGTLTIPANLTGNPAISIPAGLVGGLPVGLQVIGRHHDEDRLLALARIIELERPWPLVAPGSPR